MKNINYERDNHFILHQPFFHEGVQNYNEVMYTEPYQSLFYEFQTARDAACNQNITYIPNGCTDILFIQEQADNHTSYHIEILGSGTEARQIHWLPNASYFGIRLKPGLFLSYHGLALREVINQELFFEDMTEELAVFFHKLSKTDILSHKIELFHSYFDSYINVSDVNDLTGYILSEINSTQGNVRIHDLADELHYSERHISRIFLDSMGFTPKTFARIVRFQNVVDSILQQPMLSLCDYMSELGYSDQAHFQREFKQYTGITPRRFLSYAQNSTYASHCVGMEQQAS